jgi:uncharacterized protein (TIGR00251 family)
MRTLDGKPAPVIHPSQDGIIVSVRVTPRAGRSGIAGTRGDELLVRLAAAPVDGAANDELIAIVARAFGVPRRQVTIASGARSRSKRVAVAGIDTTLAASRLAALLP